MFARRMTPTALLGALLLGVGMGMPMNATATIPPSDSSAGARAAAAEASGDYAIDPAHSSINFTVRHMTINLIRGRFLDYSGMIHFDADDVTKSSVEFTAKTESVTTDVAPRDKHLKSADFFDVEKYPEMSFKSTKIVKHGDGFVAHGTFTLHGVTKEIELPFKLYGPISDQRGGHRLGVHAGTTIDRQEYGIAFGGKMPDGGLSIANDVQVELLLEAGKKGPKPAQ